MDEDREDFHLDPRAPSPNKSPPGVLWELTPVWEYCTLIVFTNGKKVLKVFQDSKSVYVTK